MDGGSEVDRPELTEKSDAWLAGRARELLALAQTTERGTRTHCTDEIDALLLEARRRNDPRMVGQLLRAATVIRVNDASAEATEKILAEFLAHAERYDLLVLQADAHALRARWLVLSGAEDLALTEAAVGLAMLDEKMEPDRLFGPRGWDVLMAFTLMDIGLVLAELGVYEVGDHVLRRAHRHIRRAASPHDIAVHLIAVCRMQLSWGLRLERIGEDSAPRFARAAAMASDVEGLRRDDEPAAGQLAVVGAARALAQPGDRHLPRLTRLLDTADPREVIFVAIALARCLDHAGRRAEAVAVLSDVRAGLGNPAPEPMLLLCLIREHARLSDTGTDTSTDTSGDPAAAATGALRHYVAELETQLWAMRESRVAALNTRREHERLARRHGTVARQALQDPLTGLPNRRALDERLAELAADDRPLAIALVDLDGFKSVNDRMSHADGDDVLRVVAATVRDTLRGSDMVARYGGDEFIALLPGAPLHAAAAALRRATAAVDALPQDLSHGVTLSVGVVSLRPDEPSARALARADAAMYQAKRQGGNNVVAIATTESDETRVLTPESGTTPDPGWVLPEAT